MRIGYQKAAYCEIFGLRSFLSLFFLEWAFLFVGGEKIPLFGFGTK